jgi:drug/metabolite transporter (DMT)-like permease
MNSNPQSMTWLVFVILTILNWGLYGVFLHSGQIGMQDPVSGRYKAFLFVGIAYVITAIFGPVIMLMLNGASWSFPARGMFWSLMAGLVGALGAFGVLLAFGARGTPAVVMSLIFAGAPIVNAIAAFIMHPPPGGFRSLRWQFILGIFLAALGGYLVTAFRPGSALPPKHKPPANVESFRND